MSKIVVSPADLRLIKENANSVYLQSNMPKNLEGPEFLVYCYAKAVDNFLNKKGINVDIQLEQFNTYEVVDE